MPLNPSLKSDVETGIDDAADPGEEAPLDENEAPSEETEGYDASRDARTGRPPNLLEAQRLAREHQIERVEGQTEDSLDTEEEGSGVVEQSGSHEPVAEELQAPGRMTSPKAVEEEKAAVDALVEEGVSRERAEELVNLHGANWETLKAAAFAGDA